MYNELCSSFAAFNYKTVNLVLDARRRQVKQNTCGLATIVSTVWNRARQTFLWCAASLKNYRLDNVSLRAIREIWYVHSDRHSSQMTLQITCASITPCNAHDSDMIVYKDFGV